MYNIIGKSKIWFAISLTLIFISLGSLAYNKITTGNILNFGLDFTGGTMMKVIFDKNVTKSDLKSVFDEKFSSLYPSIQSVGNNDFLIKTKELDEKNHADVKFALKEKFGEFTEKEFTTIGASVGEKMKYNAMIALLVAIVIIIFYIAYAFRNLPEELSSFKFGITAIIALAHDIIITIGVFSLMGIFTGVEIDALFITALLTVMGFSVHDTIVVFDRIRENTQRRKKTSNFEEISNNAVNQTLSRSINTSVSTLFPLIALYFFGAESIQLFVLALIVGIAIGTYSSIFIATPVLVGMSHKGELTERKSKIKTSDDLI
ncbi:protein translocase subunit SecF [Candidatus Gracilibacteria bacterium]|nr:protein translocase subunit SecF [Candidatus Gracilibacteria bacterium]